MMKNLLLINTDNGFKVITTESQEDAWKRIEEIAQEQRQEAMKKKDFIRTDGRKLLRDFGERRPLHLIPETEMFSRKVSPQTLTIAYYKELHSAWDDYIKDNLYPSVVDFSTGYLHEKGLMGIWNECLTKEQLYMDVWSELRARSHHPKSHAPKTSKRLGLVIDEARDAFIREWDTQASAGCQSTLYAYDSILIPGEEWDDLLTPTAGDKFGYTWDEWAEVGYLHFKRGGDFLSDNHALNAAGYREAVKVLRQHGIACEQYVMWD